MPTGSTITAPWTNALFASANHRLAAATLRQKVIAILADSVSLRRFISYAGDASGLGSAVMRSLYAQLGAGIPMESLAETATLTPITLDVDYRDITLGRHGLEADETFLAQGTARAGVDVSLDDVAAKIAETWEGEFNDLVGTTIATATSTVGSTGVDMSMDDFYDATYFFDLQDGADGPLIGMLHGRQIADLKESKRGEPAEWIKGPDQLAFKAPGFQGELVGVGVFKSNRVTTDGTDRKGAIWTPRAMGYSVLGEGVRAIRGLSERAILIPEIGLILDWASDSNATKSKLLVNTWFGVAIGDQGQKEIVGVVTDA